MEEEEEGTDSDLLGVLSALTLKMAMLRSRSGSRPRSCWRQEGWALRRRTLRRRPASEEEAARRSEATGEGRWGSL